MARKQTAKPAPEVNSERYESLRERLLKQKQESFGIFTNWMLFLFLPIFLLPGKIHRILFTKQREKNIKLLSMRSKKCAMQEGRSLLVPPLSK